MAPEICSQFCLIKLIHVYIHTCRGLFGCELSIILIVSKLVLGTHYLCQSKEPSRIERSESRLMVRHLGPTWAQFDDPEIYLGTSNFNGFLG